MTQEEKNAWEVYYQKQFEHEQRMEAKRPKVEDFTNLEDYAKALDEWHTTYHCAAPEKPGQHRANND